MALHPCPDGDPYLHAFGRVGEDQVGAESLEEDAALEGHGGGHGEGEFVPLRGGDESQTDPSVAACGLHERRLPRRDLTLLLRGGNHRESDAVLDRAAGLHDLELRCNLRDAPLRHLVEVHHGGASHELGDVVLQEMMVGFVFW